MTDGNIVATMTVSLPDPMKEWETETGRYSDASDYVRDLIRKDQESNDKIADMQRFIDDGLKSGVGKCSKEELFAAAVAKAEKPVGNK